MVTLLLAIIGLLIVILIWLIIIISKSKSNLSSIEEEKESILNTNNDLNVKLNALKKFQICVDAEKEASFILSEANDKAEKLISKAEWEYEDAQKKAKDMLVSAELSKNETLAELDNLRSLTIKEAKDSVRKLKEDAEAKVSQALTISNQIIQEAEVKAKEIAGSAYHTAEYAKYYEDLAKAMKNIVEGYGDSYLKPTYSVLDNLAEEYGFTEAGEELKAARMVCKRLINEGLAAKCDYVEQVRKTTAIAFILDAFNGKVDSILSLIKKDNYGTLEQKIKDSYAIVNNLGRPFRKARITQQYLDARLNELKWGAAVIALKLKDKEEQRAIKERIREEERARREYERAMKEAAKQEDTIKKAMEKARLEIEKASEEQKAKYEAQLAELEQKLAEAEAKSQRALSMAQQTKSGHVYIISNIGSFGEDVYKIGMTRRLEPLDRVRELGDASVPFPFDVHAMIFSEDAPTLETELHKIFASYQVNKVNPRKEFFRLPISNIRDYIDDKGVEVHWTIAAEAAQYRETLALEKAFANDAKAKREWEQKQDSEILELVDNEDED